MSVYLAWSVYKLIGAVVVSFAIAALVAKISTKKVRWRAAVSTYAVLLVMTLLAAFNIGDRQADLKRSKFNSSPVVTAERVDMHQLDAAKVQKKAQEELDKRRGRLENEANQTFEQAVKRTQ